MPTFSDEDLNKKRFKMAAYYKYWLDDGSVNPKVDQYSRWLMDLKNPSNRNFKDAVNHFGARLQRVASKLFEPGQHLQIAIVPSHSAGLCSEGLLQVAQFLNVPFKTNCSTDFLYRHSTVPSLKEGGNRNINTHLTSIKVNCEIAPQVRMLVIDDISTTGNSLKACRMLLNQAGAKVVALLALGQTEE